MALLEQLAKTEEEIKGKQAAWKALSKEVEEAEDYDATKIETLRTGNKELDRAHREEEDALATPSRKRPS